MNKQPAHTPTLSVIMPVCNMEGTLSRAIESVLAQDYDSCEFIIVLNGCVDSSREIAASYAKTYATIRVVEHDVLGCSHARNRGMDEARGSYIMFLDADDYYFPGAFSALMNAITHLDCDVVYSCRAEPSHKSASEVESLDITCACMLLDGMRHRVQFEEGRAQRGGINIYGQWGNVYRTAFLKQHNIYCDPQLSIGEDFLFNRDVLIHNPLAYVLLQDVYHYEIEERTADQKSPDSFDAAIASIETLLADWPYKGFATKDKAYGFASVMLYHLIGNVTKSDIPDRESWIRCCFERPAIHELFVWIVEKGDIRALQLSFGQYFDYLNKLIVRIVNSPIALSSYES